MISVSAQALAAAQTAPVIANPVIPNSQDQIIEVSIALALVLAMIYAIAWFVKRKQVVQGFTNIPMKTIGVIPMGVKEKIILIEVGGKQILLGVTANNINTLATFDEPIIDISLKEERSFSQKLKDIIAQQSVEKNDKNVKAPHDEN
ncbi:hypothetical protein NBRC116188_16220 [Oceaniserpentilla sp. 4NH20-0058]|uniref:flagellar biosynthetic protein FliO n=1 Tax=Oceaniserpentilla sp. 4NH20-0058 TaxID=3127660 RepID=UPI00310BB738